MIKHFFGILFVTLFCLSSACAQQVSGVKMLDTWDFYGQGSKLLEGHGQLLFKEDPLGSKGVVLVSPNSYSDEVIMRYKVMGLTPATVLVAILSASDKGESSDLTIAQDYDGSIKFWSGACENYFFAFHNAAHNYPPFVRRYDEKREILDMAKKNYMHVGKYYAIEVGRKGNKLWLKIDGKTVLKIKDKDPYSEGHLVLRLRGTGHEYAACLIKDFEIISY